MTTSNNNSQQYPYNQIKIQILQLQTKLNLYSDEVQYANEQTANDIDLSKQYLDTLSQASIIIDQFTKLNEQRIQQVNFIKVSLNQSMVSKTQLIIAFLQIRYAYAKICSLLSDLRFLLGYPADFALGEESFILKQISDNWLEVDQIYRIFTALKFKSNLKIDKCPTLTHQLFTQKQPVFVDFYTFLEQKYFQKTNQQFTEKFKTEPIKEENEAETFAQFQTQVEFQAKKGLMLCKIPIKRQMEFYPRKTSANPTPVKFKRVSNTSSREVSQSSSFNNTSSQHNEALSQIEQEIHEFEIQQLQGVDIYDSIQKYQEVLQISSVEQQYADQILDDKPELVQQYFDRLKLVFDLKDRNKRQLHQRESITEKLLTMVSNRKGSKSELVQNLLTLQQNTMDLFRTILSFQQTVGQSVSFTYQIEPVFELLIESFCFDAVNLCLPVLKIPLEINQLQTFFQSKVNRQKFVLMVDTKINQTVSVMTIWTNIGIQYSSCFQKQFQQVAKITSKQCVQLLAMEQYQIEQLTQVVLSCKSNNQFVCKIPVQGNNIDCFRQRQHKWQPIDIQLNECPGIVHDDFSNVM
ncbi:Conserved_hypothetical protein [Hexamita inflata]|uniref:Uncharacterized protein n=1 Tax=Hexamita inflata TaxID=28002 RepID=A0AA86P518_9EUKA|nr:Conserved hypothetical protein [Hexamita inflata]